MDVVGGLGGPVAQQDTGADRQPLRLAGRGEGGGETENEGEDRKAAGGAVHAPMYAFYSFRRLTTTVNFPAAVVVP